MTTKKIIKTFLSLVIPAAILAIAVLAPSQPIFGAVTANPTGSTVLVDGKSWTFDAYNINDFNYFKLRDIAFALNASKKQFAVDWNEAEGAVILTPGAAYKPTGEETAPAQRLRKSATLSDDFVYLDDGRRLVLEAYNIDGYNYFKLRDIGMSLDFSVAWDGSKNTIAIDSAKGYLDGNLKTYSAKTAVVTKDAALTNAYALTQFDDNGVLRDIAQKCFDVYFYYTIKDDIVLVIEEDGDLCRVVIPYGEPPRLRGYLKKSEISYDSRLISAANQCNFTNAQTYDINGAKGEIMSGTGQIVERKNGKVLLSLLNAGGVDNFWIDESDTTFDFDAEIVDIIS